MTSLARRRAVAAVLVLVFVASAWYFAQPRVPAGQPELVRLDVASFSTLRDAFNRDADHVRIVILQSPT
jgi:hypothetical protein